jgi:hypothetical protein
MTKTIFGKKLLMIATITVMLSGLMLVTTLDDAEAKKAKTGEHKLKCTSIGSWFNPGLTFDLVFSSSEGKCSAGLSKVTSASISVPSVTAENTPGCITLTSAFVDPPGKGDFSVGKKGFIMYATTGEQCFNDVDGVSLGATWDGSFCGPSPGSAYTSDVIGTYAISAGLVKDTPVIGGSGDFVSEANHCDDEAPYGNSFTTKLEGTIVFPG